MTGGQLAFSWEGRDPRGPRSIPSLICAFILMSTVYLVSPADGEDGNQLYDQLAAEVSADRLMQTIEHLQDFGTRAFYLNSSFDVDDYIQNRFAELGLPAELDRFYAGSHHVANVVATSHATSASGPLILVGAHSDSENVEAVDYETGLSLLAPGADDDASGIAVMMELATVLADHPLGRTVKFVAFSAEEYGYDMSGGLAGSMHYASMAKDAGVRFEATYILDMVGYRGDSENRVMAIVNDDHDAGLRSLEASRSENNINLSLTSAVNRLATYSDHFSFWSLGYPSVLLIESDPAATSYAFNPYYHTANDTIDHLSSDLMVEVTRVVLGGIINAATPEEGASALVVAALVIAVVVVVSVAAFLHFRLRKVSGHGK